MSPPVATHLVCLHAGEDADPVTSAEKIRQLESRMKVQDDRWAELTGPEGSLTKMLVRLSTLEVRVAVYVAVAMALITWGPKVLQAVAAPVVRAAIGAP